MSIPVVSTMVEDYVTLVWKAYERPGGQPSTSDLAERLGVTRSTVSANLKRLAKDGFLDYEPYGTIELTEEGRRIAIAVVRRHRLLETYLVERLGLTWDQVHTEADALEHAVSDLVLEQMDIALGRPTTDPHGDPIPSATGEVPADVSVPLEDVAPGATVRVARVSDRSAEVLRYLSARGIAVGTVVVVQRIGHEAGVVVLGREDGSTTDLSLAAASAVRVTPHAAPSTELPAR